MDNNTRVELVMSLEEARTYVEAKGLIPMDSNEASM